MSIESIFWRSTQDFLFQVDKKQREKFKMEAENLGGTDIEDWMKYEDPLEIPSFDKGGHRERSIFWQPQHRDHWKEEK